MMDGKDEPIAMDFGLASIEQPQGEQLTQAGLAMGLPEYVSPGQVRKHGRSLRHVLNELLTGALPFRGSMLRIMARLLKECTKRPSQLRPEIDLRLDAICMKEDASRSASRYGSVKTLVAALSASIHHHRPFPPTSCRSSG